MNGEVLDMTAGAEILVPEHTSHRLENIGRTRRRSIAGIGSKTESFFKKAYVVLN
jgi:mannose-6-phosphate isomerase-like protein (cupin superfamily)